MSRTVFAIASSFHRDHTAEYMPRMEVREAGCDKLLFAKMRDLAPKFLIFENPEE
jgi:hypothetical protein